jgi:hypothetical protein
LLAFRIPHLPPWSNIVVLSSPRPARPPRVPNIGTMGLPCLDILIGLFILDISGIFNCGQPFFTKTKELGS